VRATQKNMNTIAIALVDYVTDNAKTPVQNGNFEGNSEFLGTLISFYAKEIPVKDQRGNNKDFNNDLINYNGDRIRAPQR
jgi:hypothetical protein